MSRKNNNAVNGVFVPFDLWLDVLSHLHSHEITAESNALAAMRNGITKGYKKCMVGAWRYVQRLHKRFLDCEFRTYIERPWHTNTMSQRVLVQLSVVGGDESIRVFVGSRKQCYQKMAKWYARERRNANRSLRRSSYWIDCLHAVVQDDGGAFRYEWWIKDSE